MRIYVRSSRAWWAASSNIGPGRGTPEEFILGQGGNDDPDDVPQIEFVVKYHDFSGTIASERRLCAQLTVFDESWAALALWRDLWDRLADVAADGMKREFRCSPDDLEEILKGCGFIDRTPTLRDHGAYAPLA